MLRLHYLNEFVPGSHAVFFPAKIALPPVSGVTPGNVRVGAVYAPDGSLDAGLAISDAGSVIGSALAAGLSNAGLVPVRLEQSVYDGELPEGVDLILRCNLGEIRVIKHFGAKQAVHGQYFTMESRVKLRFTLENRNGEKLYAGEMTGLEEEPPVAVGHETFLPLETDPGESLSVALSRAVGALLIQPAFRRALPLRPTSGATASKGQGQAH